MGLAALLLSVASPSPPCCTPAANGMTQCPACILHPDPNPVLLVLGAMFIVSMIFWLGVAAAQSPQPVK